MKITICKRDDISCPEVEILKNEVRIGEEGNLVTLKPEEWNILVDKIKKGELKKV